MKYIYVVMEHEEDMRRYDHRIAFHNKEAAQKHIEQKHKDWKWLPSLPSYQFRIIEIRLGD